MKDRNADNTSKWGTNSFSNRHLKSNVIAMEADAPDELETEGKNLRGVLTSSSPIEMPSAGVNDSSSMFRTNRGKFKGQEPSFVGANIDR